MIRGIVKWSLQFRFLVVIIAAALIVFGITQLRNMSVDVLPEFSPPYVEIQTEALGLSAEEVEQLITVPLEQDLLNGVAWADVIRSKSVPGLSSILITFEPGTDLYRARQMVSERLTQAFALPHVSKAPVMIQPLSSTSRFMIVGLSSKELSLIEQSVLARWTIGPRLMGVPGVANVSIWGNRDRQLQVLVDPERLRDQGVSLQQVLETTGNALWVSSLSFLEASTPGTGGFIDTPNQRLGVWHVSPISSPEDLAQVPVERAAPLRLGDVAQVVEDHQPLIGDAVTNDGPGLLLVVEKLPGANTLEVTRGVEAALDTLRPGLSGMEIDTSLFRPATFIELAIANLTKSLVIAAILVVVVLGLLLFEWRVALISLVVIPISLLAALLVLYGRGESINALVLAGLVVALGVIVDDAIVDVENVARRLRQRRHEGSDQPIQTIILEASVEMRSAMMFATLILVLAVLPVFFLDGVSGLFFQPLVVSYALAVLASLVVALIITPALSMILLSGMSDASLERHQSPLVRWLHRGYDRVLTPALRKPRLAYAIVAIIMLAGLAMLPFLRQSLFPSFKEPNLLINLNGAPGTSRPEMDRIVARASRELRAIPGVLNVAAHVGRAVAGDQVVGINSSELWVSLDPAVDHDATVTAIQHMVDGYPGLQRNVRTYLQERSSGVAASPDDSLVVRVYGEDLGVLRSQAELVRQALSKIDGIVNPQVKLPNQEPTLEIEVDLAAAQRYGIKPGDVRRAAAVLLSGLQVGALFEQQKVFDVVVWSTPDTRQSLTNIRELLIDTPSGGHVRLEDVADVRIASVPNVIQHESVHSYLDVGAKLQGRDLGAVASNVERALQGVPFPLEYHAEVLGQYAERQAAQQRILGAGIVALIGIFFLLQAAYGSWRLATLAFVTLPMALAGGVLAAGFTRGGAVSLGSLVGLLMILGIAVRNGTLLISHFRHLEEQEGETFGPELILRGAKERIAPIVMTTLTIGLVLVPFVIFGNTPGHEIVQSMAIVVLGGLVTSTLLDLFVLPTLYLRFGASPEPEEPELPSVPLSPEPGLSLSSD